MKLKLIIGLALLGACASANAGPLVAVGMMYVGATAAAGAAAGTLAAVAAGAMFVGGAVQLVGYATDNKSLIKAGGIIGAVGGAAGLIGGLAGAASAAEAGTAAAEAGATDIAPLAGTETVMDGYAGAGAATAADGAATSMPAVAADAGGSVEGAGAMDGYAGAGGAANAGAGAGDAAGAASTAAPVVPAPAPAPLAGNASTLTPTPTPGQGGLVNNALSWMKANPEATKLGSGIISGAMQAYGQQQAVDAQMDYYDRLRAQFNQSVIGMNKVPQFVNQNATVTRGPVQNPTGYWTPGTPPPVTPPTR